MPALPQKLMRKSFTPPQRTLAASAETLYSGIGDRFLHRMFTPHPNLSDEVNGGIIQSEIEGGVSLNDLPPSTVLQIQTLHHCYTAVFLGGNEVLISGHPEFCPRPVQVAIAGSTWGGSMLKLQYVGRGMNLEFHHPAYAAPIVTSPIQEIRDSLHPRREGQAFQSCR